MSSLFLLLINLFSLYFIFEKGNILTETIKTQSPKLFGSCLSESVFLCNLEVYILLSSFLVLPILITLKILRNLEIPNLFLGIGIASLLGNIIFLSLFNKILDILKINSYNIEFGGIINFIFIVAFFTILNTLYSIFIIN